MKAIAPVKAKFPYPKRFSNHPVVLMLLFLKSARRRGVELFGEEQMRLHLPHFVILALLEEAGPLSQKGVSERLGIDPSDLVGLIDRLEEYACVERLRDTHDRRRYALALTPVGREFLDNGVKRSEKLKKVLFEPLAEAERMELERLLRKLVS